MNAWAADAIHRVRAAHRPTPLRELSGVVLKDESALPTGSTKHRTVSAMFCHAIANGRIGEGTQVVAATAGAVAVASAHLAGVLGLPFTALVPARTSEELLTRIEREGGRWEYAEGPPAGLQTEARALADRWGGHFLDHFTEADPAVAAWPPTIADELFEQLPEPPQWVVVGAGTGATSSAIGRYLRTHGLPTRLAVVDPENSAYFPAWASGAEDYGTGMPSRIPGIGRPRVEPGFHPGVVDLVIPVPDKHSVAALRWLHRNGVDGGPATGTNLCGVHHLRTAMGQAGVIVTLIGDGGASYAGTYLDPEWVAAKGLTPDVEFVL
jgi:cysteine synthase A